MDRVDCERNCTWQSDGLCRNEAINMTDEGLCADFCDMEGDRICITGKS